MNTGVPYLVAVLAVLVLLAILALMNYYNKASDQAESKDSLMRGVGNYRGLLLYGQLPAPSPKSCGFPADF